MKQPMAHAMKHFAKMSDNRLGDLITRLERVAKLDQRLLAAARKEWRSRRKAKAA